MKKRILTPKLAQKIQDKIYYDMTDSKKIKIVSQFFVLANAIELLSKTMSAESVTSYEVTVYPAVYEKPDGTIGIFSGTSDGTGNAKLDLTSYKPATADNQLIAVTWLDTYTNAVSVTASSEVSQNTNLLTRSGFATLKTLINECAASRPAESIPSKAFLLKGDATYIEIRDELTDLRPFFHSPERYGFPNPITRQTRIWAGYQVVISGDLTVNDTKELIVQGELVVI